jgi:hypothetical protein
MTDTNPNTEQQEIAPISSVAEATLVKDTQPPAEPEEDEADDAVEGEDGEEVPRTEFMNLKDALVMGQKQLKSKHFGNAANLRQFLIMDLYPILIEIAEYANWYVGDLHNRVMGLEMGESSDGGEALTPETAEQLINFIGMSLQIFGVILQSPKVDPKLLHLAQILTTQAPGLIAKVQDITMSDEPDDENEDYEDDDEGYEEGEGEEVEDESGTEPTEVLEPRGREPVQAAPKKIEDSKTEAEAEQAPVPIEYPTSGEAEPATEEASAAPEETITEEASTAPEEAITEEAPKSDLEEEKIDG